MIRSVIAATVLIGAAIVSASPGNSQPVQSQFSPPPPIVPLPGTEAGNPPTAWPGPYGYSAPHIPHAKWHHSYAGRARVAIVPHSVLRGRHNYSDRVARCTEAGAAAGIHPGHLGAFVSRCAD